MKLIFYYITDCTLDNRIAHATHVNEICKNFVKLGHQVTLYAPLPRRFEPSAGYKTVFITTPPKLIAIFYQIKLFFRLLRDIRKNRPQVIYTRHSQFLFIPTTVGKLFRIPVVLEVNGNLIDEFRQLNKNFIFRVILKTKILEAIEFINLKLATGIIVVSSGIKEYFEKKYSIAPDKIKVLSNGVDVDIFKKTNSPIELRKDLNLNENSIYVGYIGSLHMWQGLRYFVGAARLISEVLSNVKFLILGDGDESSYISQFILKNKLESFIELRAAAKHELVPSYINAMDICISYCIKKRGGTTSPFKIYEYLACEKPVVVSDIDGMKSEFGEVVKYADAESPESLASVLISLIDDKDERNRLGKLGRDFIEQGHSWQAVAKKSLEFIEKIFV